MAHRTDWIDYGKGLGIILVVYAHLLSSAYNAGLGIQEHFFLLSDSIVYSFHMPLFFFLAGLFVEQSYRKRGGIGFLADKAKLLVYPYFIWSFLQISVELVFSQHSLRGVSVNDLLAVPYLPWSQFWFLYALFLMYFSYALFSRFGKITMVAMMVSAVVLYMYPIRTPVMALNGFSTEFVFFVAGILTRARVRDLEHPAVPGWAALPLLCFLIGSGYAIFTYMIPPERLISGAHPVYFLFMSVVGITLCIGLAQYLARKQYLQFIRILGIYSLQIYLAHMLVGVAARISLLKLFHLQNSFLHMIIGVAAGLAVPVLLYKASMRIGFPYVFAMEKGGGK